MNNKVLLYLAGAGALAYYLLKGKKEALENLKISPLDIAIDTKKSKEAKWLKLYYNIKIKLINDSSFSINVNNIDIDFLINDRVLGNIQKDQLINVPGKSQKTIILTSYIETATTIQSILLILADRSKIKLAVNGEVETDLGTLSVNYDKNVGI